MERLRNNIAWTLVFALIALSAPHGVAAPEAGDEIVQAEAILTVAEGKRLIGRGVAQMPIVRRALKKGMVIITKGTTNTYVAEEILGRKLPHGPLVYGRVYPAKGGERLEKQKPMPEIVLVDGKEAKDLPFAEALTKLQPGDVVIKGGNALDYEHGLAGVMIGAPNGGTSGAIMPYVVARKAWLVIPIGLEKEVAGGLVDLSLKMREPVRSLGFVPSMFLLSGEIVTEIEALGILGDVEVFQAGAGGIGGAEGAVRLVMRGSEANVKKALAIVESVQGEKPFTE